jgi:hypothetical protein
MSPTEFSSVDFVSLDPGDQIDKCRELAQHAAVLAAHGDEQFRAHHCVLAERWSALADRLRVAGRGITN